MIISLRNRVLLLLFTVASFNIAGRHGNTTARPANPTTQRHRPSPPSPHCDLSRPKPPQINVLSGVSLCAPPMQQITLVESGVSLN